jgi:diguanylate cyclase (GGDEF)-like protein
MNPDKFKDGYCRWTADRRLLYANASFLRMMGISENERREASSFTFNEMCKTVVACIDCGNDGYVEDFQIQLARENGGILWLSIDAQRVSLPDGGACIEAYVSDITKLRENENALTYLSLYDTLTGLPNRELFSDCLLAAIHESRNRPDTKCAVVSFDVRNFGDINMHYGRNFGDVLLRHAGEIIRNCCREDDFVARTDTDVFTVLLRALETGGQIVNIVKRIRDRLGAPFRACGRMMNSIKVDVGILFPLTEYITPESVLHDVDIASSKAKLARRGSGCKFFSRRMRKETSQDLSLVISLQSQRNLEGFFLEYQPIVRQKDGCLHSLEALARWNHEGLGNVPPSVFIPIAEKTGYIKKLGSYVIEESCRQLRRWQDEFGTNIEIHVNISPYQLFLRSFPDNVRTILLNSSVNAAGLLFEVTESALLNDFDKVLYNINAIRKLGVRFCLDDFGTGYSSLSYLKHLPIDYLKIDRTFIMDVERDEKTKKLLEHIISIGEDMGYSLIVEGVESQAQIELLRDYRKLLIQGYYYHRPLNAESAGELIKKERRAAITAA